MKFTTPSYYQDFKCTNSSCNDNCCKAGWNILIDNKTLKKYNSIPNSFGKLIRENICKTDDGYYIKMNSKCVCPFLNEKGLCNIILNKGENYICETCKNHPRFFNYLCDRTEMGLGLCCEEVCRLFLDQKTITRFITTGSGGKLKGIDKENFNLREKSFMICYESADYKTCINNLKNEFNLNDINLINTITKSNLEFIGEDYSHILNSIQQEKKDNHTFSNVELINLILYFIYRYSFANNYVAKFCQIVNFAIFSIEIIKATEQNFSNKIDCIKEFSKQIEYSEQNVQNLLNNLIWVKLLQ